MKERNPRATKEKMAELTSAIAANACMWKYGDDAKFSRLYEVDKSTVKRIRLKFGAKPNNYKTIKTLVERNPNLTFDEVVRISGLNPKTVVRINREQKLGLKQPPISHKITQEAIEGLLFHEIVKQFGISDGYLCHLIKRKGLKIMGKRGVLCGSR